MWYVDIHQTIDVQVYKIFLHEYSKNEKPKIYFFGNNGELKSESTKEFELLTNDTKHLMVIPNPEILQAFAEGLKKAGFIAEIDNSQRISAEAIANERKVQLDYFKNLNSQLINNYIIQSKEVK